MENIVTIGSQEIKNVFINFLGGVPFSATKQRKYIKDQFCCMTDYIDIGQKDSGLRNNRSSSGASC